MIINTEYRQTHKPSYQQLDFRKLLQTGFHISFHEHWAHILDQSESFSLRFRFDFAWDQCNPGDCFIRNYPTHIVLFFYWVQYPVPFISISRFSSIWGLLRFFKLVRHMWEEKCACLLVSVCTAVPWRLFTVIFFVDDHYQLLWDISN